MYTFLFRNRLGAIGFVVLTVIGAASLVGSDEQEGIIAKTTKTIENQREEFDETAASMSAPDTIAEPPSPMVIEFTEDEDLIDDTQGLDPTPEAIGPDLVPESVANANVAEEGEVVMVLIDERPKKQSERTR